MSFVENHNKINYSLEKYMKLPNHKENWHVYCSGKSRKQRKLALGLFTPINYESTYILPLQFEISNAITKMQNNGDTRMSYLQTDDYMIIRRESHNINSSQGKPNYDLALLAIISTPSLENILDQQNLGSTKIPEWSCEFEAFKLIEIMGMENDSQKKSFLKKMLDAFRNYQ